MASKVMIYLKRKKWKTENRNWKTIKIKIILVMVKVRDTMDLRFLEFWVLRK